MDCRKKSRIAKLIGRTIDGGDDVLRICAPADKNGSLVELAVAVEAAQDARNGKPARNEKAHS